jgi:short-subunit dehydrogenase
MSSLKNKTALVTGGASGIGKLMVELLYAKGVNQVAIFDIDEQKLNEFKIDLEKRSFKVFTYCLDITNTESLKLAVTDIFTKCGTIDILINNAGVVVGKKFSEHSHADIDRTMGVNSTAIMHLTRLVLPVMLEKNVGHIVNIASAAGLVSNPMMSVYCASKWSVIGWSDSLRVELEELKTNIKVSTIMPYYIRTGMFDGVSSPLIPLLMPEYAAKKIIQAIEKDKIFFCMPRIIYLVPILKSLLPTRAFDLILGKIFGIYSGMKTFKGHQK